MKRIVVAAAHHVAASANDESRPERRDQIASQRPCRVLWTRRVAVT